MEIIPQKQKLSSEINLTYSTFTSLMIYLQLTDMVSLDMYVSCQLDLTSAPCAFHMLYHHLRQDIHFMPSGTKCLIFQSLKCCFGKYLCCFCLCFCFLCLPCRLFSLRNCNFCLCNCSCSGCCSLLSSHSLYL